MLRPAPARERARSGVAGGAGVRPCVESTLPGGSGSISSPDRNRQRSLLGALLGGQQGTKAVLVVAPVLLLKSLSCVRAPNLFLRVGLRLDHEITCGYSEEIMCTTPKPLGVTGWHRL